MRSRSTAFTLIELLVVISIIVLMIAILLPALQSARKSAQAIKSLAQIRQLGFALHMYAQDNKLHLPYNRARSAAQVAAGTYSSAGGAYWSSNLYYGNYMKSKDIFFSPGHAHCPSFSNFGALFTSKEWFEWRMIDYADNFLGAMPDENSSSAIAFRIDSATPPPSNHILLFEGVRTGDFGLPSGHGYFSFNGAVNRVYMDGHGASRKGDDLGWNGVDGFIGTVIPNPKPNYAARTAAPWYRMGFPEWW